MVMMAINARAVLLAVSIVVGASVLCSAHKADVSYCNKDAEYAVKVKEVDISPYPVKRGRHTTFSISARTASNITNGKLAINVKYIGIPVYQEDHDLCKETSCPVLSGDFVLSHKESLPIITPPGTYTLKMAMLGEDGNELTCVTFDFSIGFWAVADS